MSTETLIVTDFLLARIAEDEAAARSFVGMLPEALVPARRVLGECAAKRQIVELHEWALPGGDYVVCMEDNCEKCPAPPSAPSPASTPTTRTTGPSGHDKIARRPLVRDDGRFVVRVRVSQKSCGRRAARTTRSARPS